MPLITLQPGDTIAVTLQLYHHTLGAMLGAGKDQHGIRIYFIQKFLQQDGNESIPFPNIVEALKALFRPEPTREANK